MMETDSVTNLMTVEAKALLSEYCHTWKLVYRFVRGPLDVSAPPALPQLLILNNKGQGVGMQLIEPLTLKNITEFLQSHHPMIMLSTLPMQGRA